MRLTTVTGYDTGITASLCGQLHPITEKSFCTLTRHHGGDHYHEYTGRSWTAQDKPRRRPVP
ncbi:hypothetical protein [Streptomyces sp. NPDC020141]|uniref:hypothetical protein n=1 Tax=Streptomyces sp. NPDC020141 TaxID=3365065 RepID=UPI0037AD9038